MGLMDKQTQQAFALGGLNDEGGEIDEASGNRVPIGGTKEGVRDDIEINISEGEFVFPADVVRYHGLDKMMALRQEAKMGLKQMERMGQMGNSEEATMPDDLPFGMADLIVVGGEGEPMEFAEGGFVPQMQTLQTAPVPTMGGGTSTGTQTPIVYDDFMKTPVVTMQEYRDANGNSIIITSVNGKATTEIPAGYTLYVPPTNAAPTATQAAIQTANNYSYQTSGGGDEGPDTPRELQVDPDYASMDNDTYFSTMERQNSFGGKAGNAAAMGIAMAMGPFGLLTMGMLQADKRRQLAAAEQRIAAETNPTKKKAYQATFAKMGGKTKEPEEENALVKFGKGFVTAVSGMFGLGNNDVEKVANVAASAAADNTNVVSTAPERSLLPQLRPAGLGASAKSIAPAESTMDIMGGVGTKFTPAPPTGTSNVVTQLPPMQSSDASVTTTPKIETTAKPARPKPGESTLEVAQQTQRPLTIPSGGVDDTAAIQAGMEPVVTEADISDTLQRLPAGNIDRFIKTTFSNDDSRNLDNVDVARLVVNQPRVPAPAIERPVTQTDMQMGIDPKNIYPTREQELLNVDMYNTNAQYRQIMGDVNDPRYMAEKYSKLRTPSQLLDRQGSEVPSLLGEKYPISTQAARDAAKRGTFQPAYTTGVQTDAALGAQTDYGRRIAESMARTAATPVRGTDVAGPINTAIPTAAVAQTSVPDRVPESPDATRRYGPDELSYIDDRTFRDTRNIAAGADYNLQQPQTPVEKAQQVAYNARRTNERTENVIQPFTSSPFTDVAATDDSMGLPTGPLPDPRDNVSNISTGTGSQLQLGYGNFNAAEARQAALDQTANAFGQIGSAGPTSVGNYATAVKKANPYLGEPFAAEKTKRYDAFGDEIKEISTDIKDFATPMDAPASKVEAKKSDAARTSKGTSTRKAAPTGDDRRSEPNFLERAFGIEPAKISARRGNDGVLYRTQADKREADKRQEDAKTIQRNSDRYKAVNTGYTDNSGKKHARGQAARDAFNKDNAADISTRHGGDKKDSDGKIVCSAMNNAYGFGSFRNKIWLEHSKNNLTKEHQVGYHRMFLPLIHLGYNKDYKFIRKCLEHIARHRTADIYFQSKSNKRDTLGMVYRTILEPICYLVGMFPTSKDNK